MSITIVEGWNNLKKTKISIKPYFENRPNMGLEKYGKVLFEGVHHEEDIACTEEGDQKRYITGLDEFAMAVKTLPSEKRTAKVKVIRDVISHLEKEIALNMIDVEDERFWEKVKIFGPTNDKYWSKVRLRVNDDGLNLDPENPHDLVKIYAIEAGAFSIVAPSLDAARNMSVAPKFYLDKVEDSASVRNEMRKLSNKATAELEKLFNKNQKKMTLIAKMVLPSSSQYKFSDPSDVVYEELDKFIKGESVQTNKKLAAQRFIDACILDPETLTIECMVRDAGYYRFIQTKADGYIYNATTGSMLGKNNSDVVEYLKNPLNEKEFEDIREKVEKYWKA
jgi:hypothetical protein